MRFPLEVNSPVIVGRGSALKGINLAMDLHVPALPGAPASPASVVTTPAGVIFRIVSLPVSAT